VEERQAHEGQRQETVAALRGKNNAFTWANVIFPKEFGGLTINSYLCGLEMIHYPKTNTYLK
jgi:hypothetical protein